MRPILAFLALIVLAARPVAAQTRPTLTVYAAASLKDALDEVDAAYAKSRGAAKPTVSYGASSALARQIEQGAPADVFISADSDWMDYASGKGLIRPETRRNLLSNRLALIAPATSSVKIRIGRGMPLAQALGRRRLAMAGPDVPAGRYGQAALASLGIWDSVRPKTVFGENVRAALRFVSRGEAPLGIVYDTDAMIDRTVKIVGLFPENSHPRIVYPIAATRRSASPATLGYLAFLSRPQAAAIFRKYGFKTLDR
jgi:molybdate transport system substrate-binding protein